jgi:pheromone shutdown protein TraB
MDINFGLLATYVVSLLIMIGFPIALVFFATSRLKVSWWAILAGVLTFIGSHCAFQHPRG